MKTEHTDKKESIWADVRRYCRRQALFAQGDRVIAAVSGGADSMALLLFLLENAASLGIRVEAVHVNHRLRGAESDGDEDFVRAFCQSRGVPLTLFWLGQGAVCLGSDGRPCPEEKAMEKLGRENGLTGKSEEEARRARYACFEGLAGGPGGPGGHRPHPQRPGRDPSVPAGPGLRRQGCRGHPAPAGDLPAALFGHRPGRHRGGLPPGGNFLAHRRHQPGGGLRPQPAAPSGPARPAGGKQRGAGGHGALLRPNAGAERVFGGPGGNPVSRGLPCPGAAGTPPPWPPPPPRSGRRLSGSWPGAGLSPRPGTWKRWKRPCAGGARCRRGRVFALWQKTAGPSGRRTPALRPCPPSPYRKADIPCREVIF